MQDVGRVFVTKDPCTALLVLSARIAEIRADIKTHRYYSLDLFSCIRNCSVAFESFPTRG